MYFTASWRHRGRFNPLTAQDPLADARLENAPPISEPKSKSFYSSVLVYCVTMNVSRSTKPSTFVTNDSPPVADHACLPIIRDPNGFGNCSCCGAHEWLPMHPNLGCMGNHWWGRQQLQFSNTDSLGYLKNQFFNPDNAVPTYSSIKCMDAT